MAQLCPWLNSVFWCPVSLCSCVYLQMCLLLTKVLLARIISVDRFVNKVVSIGRV